MSARSLDDVSWLREETQGPPLVLLHGAGGNATVWETPMRELSGFDRIAIDLPGRRGSVGPAHDRASSTAEWLAGVLRALGGPPPLVVGHSYGGAVAIELALGAEIELGGLVLTCTGGRLRVHPSILAMAEQAVARGAATTSRIAFVEPDSDAAHAYEARCAETPPEATLADWRACDGFDRLAQLEEIGVPTLVVAGADDALTPLKFHRRMADSIERCSLRVVEDAGHMLPWEQPRALASAIRAWAAGVGEV